MAKAAEAPATADATKPADAAAAAPPADAAAAGGDAPKEKKKKDKDKKEEKKKDEGEEDEDEDDEAAKKKKDAELKKDGQGVQLKPGEELFHANMHPAYKQYFKQMLSGVPMGTIEAAMKRKNLNPEVLKTPKLRIIYKGKPQKKKSAMEILVEEEARQAILLEDELAKREKELYNPLDDIDWNKPEFQGVLGMVRKARAYAEAKKKIVAAAAFKYGPPYSDDYGGSILDECNKAQPSTLEVHQMLLDGADPNVTDKDPEEGFENTPLHYCGRFCHPYIAKMLVKAKAQPDRPNELGVTPLGTLCMFNQPPDRRKMHLNMVKWLLELEFKADDKQEEPGVKVDVNHVDKGGHTALEFAAKHGNIELVACLLKNGARVKRDAQFISLKSVNLLDPEICWDSTCRQLLKTKWNEELRVEQEVVKALKQKRVEQEALERDRERALAIQKRHEDKHTFANDKHLYEQQLEIDNIKKKNREEAKKTRLKLLEERRNDGGSWMKRRGESARGLHDSEWHFVEGIRNGGIITGTVYDEASWMSKQMVEKHSFAVMSKRWKEVTGHGLLTREDVTDMGYGVDEVLKEVRDRQKEEEALFGKLLPQPAEGGGGVAENGDNSDEESTGHFAGRFDSKKGNDKAAAESGGADATTTAGKHGAAATSKVAESLPDMATIGRRRSITGAGFKMPKLF